MKQLVVKVTGYVNISYPDTWGNDPYFVKGMLKDRIAEINAGELEDVDKEIECIEDLE